MQWQFTPFIIPLLLAAAVSAVLALYALRRPAVPGTKAYAVSMLCAGWWAAVYALELASAAPAQAELMARLQYLGVVPLPVAWLAFALAYTGARPSRRLVGLLIVTPALTLAMLASNDVHGLMWDQYHMEDVGGFLMLRIHRGPWFWVHTAYSYTLLLGATARLLLLFIRSPSLYRAQARSLLIAALAPWLGNVAFLTGLRPSGQIDLTAFMFTISGLFISRSLHRFGLLDMMPIAFATVIENMPDGMLVLDRERRVVHLNGAAAAVLGVRPPEAVGLQIDAVLARSPALSDCCREWSCEQQGIWLEREDRRYCYDVRVSPLQNGREKPAGWVVTMRDVTTAREVQQALAESEARYRSIVETAPSLILTVDSNGIITSSNLSVEAILGFHPDEVIGQRLHDLIHPDDWPRVSEQLADTTEPDRRHNLEYRMVRRDGQPVHVNAYCAPLPISTGATVHIVYDVSDRRRLEAQYQQAQRMEAIGHLAGGVAHDFNNLLTVINGYLDFLRDELARDGRLLGDVEEIRRAAERAAILTRQLLALSRRKQAEAQIICLNDVIQGVASMLQRALGERITLSLALADDLWQVRADPAQIEQVILNLTLNSKDAMPEGGTLTLATANVELDADFVATHANLHPGPHVCLSVHDTGIGMGPEVMSHLFQPFFTTKEKGTGLGLATVYSIVRQTGGSVYAESTPGEGTTFRIYFARAHQGDLPPGDDSQCAPLLKGSETILVVEDEESVRTLTASALRRLGYNVLEASGAGEARALWLNSPKRPDLVIADIVMPNVNGPELVRSLREADPSPTATAVPVLYMTGYAPRDEVRQSLDGPVMEKPFHITELARMVRDTLDARGC